MPITLNPITQRDIRDGGYHINANAQGMEANHGILLEVGRFGPWIDITNGYTVDHMPPLLEAMAAYMWGSVIQCKALQVDFSAGVSHRSRFRVLDPIVGEMDRAGTIVAESAVRDVPTPVQPIQGPLAFGRNLLVRLGHEVPALRYVGLPGGNGIVGKGRVLYYRPINNRYYFCRNWEGVSGGPDTQQPPDPDPGGWFTTNPMKRGLDCTTYPLVAYNVVREYNEPGPNQWGDGEAVSIILNASPCNMEGTNCAGVAVADVRTFFQNNPRGDFIMWRPDRHCVMVLNGFVHEFNTPNMAHGYVCTEVQSWLANKTGNLCVRSMPGTAANSVGGGAGGPGGSVGGPKSGNGQAPGGNGGGNGGGGGGNGSAKMYTVVSGDSLSLIAGRFYGDVLLWPVIYDANKSVVGPNPNLIKPGQKFTIPSISGYSQAQLNAIRQRGKNC